MSRTHTRRLTRLSAAALIAGAATFAVATPAFAHDELVGTELVADTSDGTLDAIRLTFSNSILETGTEIVVTGPDGSDALDGAPVVAGPDVTQTLASSLAAGEYDAAWRVVSSDGHPIEGAFAFTVAADGTATQAETAPAEDDHAEGESGSDHEHAEGESADHEHAEGEEHTDGAADTEADGGMPVGGIVAISIAAVAAAGAAATAAVVGQRRRKQAMGGEASPETTPEAPSPTDGEDQR